MSTFQYTDSEHNENNEASLFSDFSADFWSEQLEKTEQSREKYNKKHGWSSRDCYELEIINSKLEFFENMLEWCYYRDVEGWTWSDWCESFDEENQPHFNPSLGNPFEENKQDTNKDKFMSAK
jgi:hypothetical protein